MNTKASPSGPVERLVRRLREAADDYTIEWGSGDLYDRAADEIERLLAANRRLIAAQEPMRELRLGQPTRQGADVNVRTIMGHEEIRNSLRDYVCSYLRGLSESDRKEAAEFLLHLGYELARGMNGNAFAAGWLDAAREDLKSNPQAVRLVLPH